MTNHKAYLKIVQLYAHNVPPSRMVKRAYGAEADEGYLEGKIRIIEKRGFLFWTSTLDPHRAEAVMADAVNLFGEESGLAE
jgi:hypothetical protein